ncbi:uncharacterized protein METZ01_LOCUS321398, partial [marine metagenome]
MRLFSNANYPFIERRRVAYVFSALLILVGVVAMVLNVLAIG